MDKLTAIKILNEDGTYSDEIPVGADASNINTNNGYTVEEALGTIDVSSDGSIAEQLAVLKQNSITTVKVSEGSLIINTVE